MSEPNLFVISIAAFVAVGVLLSLLAALIRLLTWLFPAETGPADDAVVAGIHAAVAAAYPDRRLTKIEEVR